MNAPDEEVRKLMLEQSTRSGQKPRDLIERFGGAGATPETLDTDQRAAFIGFCQAEERAAAKSENGAIPKAHHSCSDLANANRLLLNYGKRLLSVGGRIYAWRETHWAPDDGEAHRCAANLSAIIAQEQKAAHKEYRALAETDVGVALAALEHPQKSSLAKSEEGRKLLAASAKAVALQKWGLQSEMKSRQDAALGLLRSMLDFDITKLDANPWLLNCQSGTIDLRNGLLKPHDPTDYSTRCCPVTYEPNAPAPTFERFLSEITGDDSLKAEFLQRWYGYCSTGSVREQNVVVHVGRGGNGKGSLLTAIQDVLGEYAGTAAQGLIADNGRGSDRHPTEIADLMGKRLVTAHEPDDGAVVREGFLKQATGGDKMKGRFMRSDFVEFDPTHKLQLLTNYKPVVKGQDHGIWRRLLLVHYPIKFGDSDAVAAGKAAHLKDPLLPEKLLAERVGIFAWLVRGAVSWYGNGLKPPPSVVSASREYQGEQDRIGQFVSERCVVEPNAWAPYTGPEGIYTAYSRWCKENGFNPLAMTRFLQELSNSVPTFQKAERKINAEGRRKTVRGASGLRLEDSPETEFPDLEQTVPEAAQAPVEAPTPVAAIAEKPEVPSPAPEAADDIDWPEPRDVLMRQLDIEADIADLLVAAELFSAEQIANANGKLKSIEEFNDTVIKELQARANKVLEGRAA